MAAVWVTRPPLAPPCPRTLLALGCHVGMADEKAEDNLKKTKLPRLLSVGDLDPTWGIQ